MTNISNKARRSRDLRHVVNDTGGALRVGKESHSQEIGVYQATNVFSYQSSWGTTALHDVIETTGTGATSAFEGAIKIHSGATTGSTASIETVRRGEYQPGKTAEVGLGLKVITRPTGDGYIRFGMFDSQGGFYYEITADEIYCVINRSGTETKIPQAEWNLDVLDGTGAEEFNDTNPGGATLDLTKAYIWGCRFSYYGVGTINFLIDTPAGADSPTEMINESVHRYHPDNFPSVDDPNKPITVEVSNGTSTTDVEVLLAGRRYDILGELFSDSRTTGAYRQNATVSNSEFTPIISFRKKDQWPAGSGKINSVNSYVNEFSVTTDEDIVVYVVSGGTVSNGAWATPFAYQAAETSLESNITVTTYTMGNPIYGPILVKANTRGNSLASGASKELRIPLPGSDQNITLVARSLGAGTATVSGTLIFTEAW